MPYSRVHPFSVRLRRVHCSTRVGSFRATEVRQGGEVLGFFMPAEGPGFSTFDPSMSAVRLCSSRGEAVRFLLGLHVGDRMDHRTWVPLFRSRCAWQQVGETREQTGRRVLAELMAEGMPAELAFDVVETARALGR